MADLQEILESVLGEGDKSMVYVLKVKAKVPITEVSKICMTKTERTKDGKTTSRTNYKMVAVAQCPDGASVSAHRMLKKADAETLASKLGMEIIEQYKKDGALVSEDGEPEEEAAAPAAAPAPKGRGKAAAPAPAAPPAAAPAPKGRGKAAAPAPVSVPAPAAAPAPKGRGKAAAPAPTPAAAPAGRGRGKAAAPAAPVPAPAPKGRGKAAAPAAPPADEEGETYDEEEVVSDE